MSKTTIEIYVTTKKRLNGYKPTPMTTYDWVINWLMDQLEEKENDN